MMKVAIVTALYNNARHLPDLFGSLERLDYPREQVEIIMIDNSPDRTIRNWIEQNVIPRSGKELPVCHFLWSEKNTGFAGGYNRCIALALTHGCDAVYLLNDDAFGEPTFLKEAVAVMEASPSVGAVQSLILLHPVSRGTNTIGNSVHFLGLSWCDGYKLSRADAEGLLRVRALTDPHLGINSASGAGVLFRADALKKVGLLDESYFLYHEDLDLSWRLREAGFGVVIAPRSVIYHKYEFKKSISKFYWMERNRYRLCLEHYKIRTLLVLLPAFLLSELGLMVFSIASGTLTPRLRAYGYILNPFNWPAIYHKRQRVQETRIISDRELLHLAVSSITFQDVQHPIMQFINPLMGAYWAVAKRLIYW